MKILNKLFKNKDLSCSDELNILDIENNMFYSLDGYVSLYIKVEPVLFEYLSINDKERIIKNLIKELSGENGIIKIIIMSLPISTTDVDNYLNKIRNDSQNSFKRSMLLKEIEDIDKLSYNGEMIEKQVIIQLFQKLEDGTEEKLQRRGKELTLKLRNAGIFSRILDKKEIIQLFNSFLNMNLKEEYINEIWSDENE